MPDALIVVPLAEADFLSINQPIHSDHHCLLMNLKASDFEMFTANTYYADLPGGHSEGYDDTFKQIFRRFYASIEDEAAEREYPQFVDGLRQLTILQAEVDSSQKRARVDVPAFQA